jgi:hypothetical protein
MSELISHSFGNNPGFSESHSMRRPSCWSTIKPVVRSEKRAAFSVAKGEMLAYSLKKGAAIRPFMHWRLQIFNLEE